MKGRGHHGIVDRSTSRPGMTDFDQPLFDDDSEPVLRARSSDPDTSHEAMASYDPERMKSASTLAVLLHRVHGPMALFELEPLFAEAWGQKCAPNVPRMGRKTAGDAGILRPTGEKRINPVSGNACDVWQYKPGPPPKILRCSECGGITGRDWTIPNPGVELLQPPCQ